MTRTRHGAIAALLSGALLGGCATTPGQAGPAGSSVSAAMDGLKPVAGVAYLDPIRADAPGLDRAVGRLIDDMARDGDLLCAALLRRTDAPESGERLLLEAWKSGAARTRVMNRNRALVSELDAQLLMPFASRLADPYAAFGQSALRVQGRVSLSHLDIKPKQITRGFALARDLQEAKARQGGKARPGADAGKGANTGLAASGIWKERTLSNHMSLVDIHGVSERPVPGAEVVGLRRRLAPLSGSPFNQRTYRVSRLRGCGGTNDWIAGGAL